MKVILRIRGGITTKTIELPKRLVMSEFKVPLIPKMNLALFSNESVQGLITPDSTQNKCLVFRWDRKSKWGSGSPIMDLVDYY